MTNIKQEVLEELTQKEKERVAVLDKIDLFKKELETLPKNTFEDQAKILSRICHLSIEESYVGTQSSSHGLKFHWFVNEPGDNYYGIFRSAIATPRIAELMYFGPFNKLIETFFKPNNGWHN